MMSLPILSSRFFQEHRPDLGFFSKWASVFAWNERILPIYEWQGVLYIGCLSSPENFPRLGAMKVVCVLCEAGALQDLWLEFQGATPLDNNLDNNLPELDLSSDLNLDLELNLNPETETPPALESALEDQTLSLVTEEDKTPVADLTAPVAPQASQAPATSAPEDLFSLEDVQAESSSEEAKASEDESLDNGLLDLSGALDTPPASGASPLVALQPLTAKEDAETAPAHIKLEIAPDISSQTPAHAAAAASETKRATPAKSEVLLKGEITGTGDMTDVTRIAQNALLSTPDEKLDGWMEQIFKDMEAKYQKCMILLKKGERVRAWKWDQKFGPPEAVSTGISLIQPSPFRIVARTKKPYHGYVVKSEIADKFFGEWNDYITPEHMTIAPILVGDHVIGMLLALGTKESSDNKEALTLAEREAGSIAKHINSQPKKALAA